jgi:Leucine-rich repeat (LRR) protein
VDNLNKFLARGNYNNIQDLNFSSCMEYIVTTGKWQLFCEALSKCCNLQKLSLVLNSFDTLIEDQLQLFYQALGKCHNLQVLNLSDVGLGAFPAWRWQLFCEALSKCHNLQELGLSSNKLTPPQWQVFGEVALSKLINLKKLDLSSTDLYKLTPPQWQAFSEYLGILVNLKKLCLRANDLNTLNEEQWQTVGELLNKCTNLQELDLSSNNLHSLTLLRWQAFSKALSKCHNVQDLNLSCNTFVLSVWQWQSFGEAALSKLLNLKKLDLRANNLHTFNMENWQAFGEALNKCTNLQELILSHNHLHTLNIEQWQAFGEALNKCINLQELSFSQSCLDKFTAEQWQAFKRVLSKIGLYRHFSEYKFTKYNEQYHKTALIKSRGFFEASTLADDDGAQEILKFLSTEDICRLAQVCKKTLALKELNKFVKEYFKNLFMSLDYDVLVNIKAEFLRDKEFVLDAVCEINNARKYNIDIRKIREFVSRFPSENDKKQINKALKLQNAQDTHLVKFYNSHELYQILEDALKLFFDFEEDLDIPDKRLRMGS